MGESDQIEWCKKCESVMQAFKEHLNIQGKCLFINRIVSPNFCPLMHGFLHQSKYLIFSNDRVIIKEPAHSDKSMSFIVSSVLVSENRSEV